MSTKRFSFFTLMLMIAALSSLLLASCVRPGTPTSTANNGGSSGNNGGSNGGSSTPTVHMGASNFLVSSITIPKGSMLTLVDDDAVPHIIKNGSWVNGTQKPAKEAGAPTVSASFNGNDTHQVGPFNTPGTYHLFCTIHTNMNLTVVVSNSSGSGSGNGNGSGSGSSTVHLGSANFLVSSVTIKKGSTLTLIDDAAVPHIIKNGSWVNGAQKPAKEPGAPTVDVNFSGKDTHTIGPFNTAGTFHIFCTIHVNMNLTIIVK